MRVETGRYMKVDDTFFYVEEYVKVVMKNGNSHIGTISELADSYITLDVKGASRGVTMFIERIERIDHIRKVK